MKNKNERLKTSTLKFVAKIIINTKEHVMRKYDMIKDETSLAYEFSKMISSFHNDIMLAIRLLNGLPILDSSFIKLGYLPDSYLSKDYAEKSILWEGSLNSELITDNVYKGRFIINMLISIDSNLSNILNKEIDYRGKKKNNKEMITLLFQIRECIGNFIMKFADNNIEFMNELIKINELVIIDDDNSFKKLKKTLSVINREVNRLNDMMHPGFLDGVRPSDDILIQNICLLAYVLSTGEYSVKNTFMVPEDINLKDKESIKVLIEVLGSCILRKRIDEKPYPEVYRWYLHSLPKINYRFKDINYNECLAEGCRALSFLSFYTGNKSINKIISKMIY